VQKYGFNIPANMYAAGALRRLLALNEALWGSAEVQRRAGQLLADISAGLQKWATTKAPDGSTVYAYEVGAMLFNLVGDDLFELTLTPPVLQDSACGGWNL
jgi:meiotically up-regulated gene 157 (Mug157) protein